MINAGMFFSMSTSCSGKKLVAGRHRLGVVSGQSLQYAPALLGGRREERGRQGRHVTPFRDPLPSGKLT